MRLGTLPSSLQGLGEFGASELTSVADSGLLEVNERNSFLVEGDLDQLCIISSLLRNS